MKTLFFITIFTLNLLYANSWLQDFSKAQQQAKKHNKNILVNFTGSDWCILCEKLEQEVFSQKEFIQYAQQNLILLMVDFPETKKLDKQQQIHNEKLRKKFKVDAFPTLFLLNPQGKVFAKTTYSKGGAEKYIEHLQFLQNKTEKIVQSAKVLEVGKNKEYKNLQQAINKALPGDKIYISAGTYSYKDSILIENKNNLLIEGKGKVALVCTQTYANVFSIIDSSYVTIKNIIGTHTRPAKGERCTGNVFFLSGGKNNTITGCDINGCGAIGIYAFSNYLKVKNNHIHNNSLWPITFAGYSLQLTDNLIEKNGDNNTIHYRYTLDPSVWVANQFFNSNQGDKIMGLHMVKNTFRK